MKNKILLLVGVFFSINLLVGCQTQSFSSSISVPKESVSKEIDSDATIIPSKVQDTSMIKEDTESELKKQFIHLYSGSEVLQNWLGGGCINPENIDTSMPSYPVGGNGWDNVKWVASSTYLTKESIYNNFESIYDLETTKQLLDPFFEGENASFKIIDDRLYLKNSVEFGHLDAILNENTVTIDSQKESIVTVRYSVTVSSESSEDTSKMIKTENGYRLTLI